MAQTETQRRENRRGPGAASATRDKQKNHRAPERIIDERLIKVRRDRCVRDDQHQKDK